MLSLKQLFWCNTYFGSHKKSWNSNMSLFVLGLKSNMYIINLNYSLFLFCKSLRFIRILVKKRKRVAFFVPEFISNYKNTLFGYNSRDFFKLIIYVITWVFGLLTNARVLNTKYPKYFKDGFPSVIILFSTSKYEYIINESTLMGLPTIGFVDTGQNPLLYDYAIPANANINESLYFYNKVIVAYIQVLVYKEKFGFFKQLILNNYEKLK